MDTVFFTLNIVWLFFSIFRLNICWCWLTWPRFWVRYCDINVVGDDSLFSCPIGWRIFRFWQWRPLIGRAERADAADWSVTLDVVSVTDADWSVTIFAGNGGCWLVSPSGGWVVILGNRGRRSKRGDMSRALLLIVFWTGQTMLSAL